MPGTFKGWDDDSAPAKIIGEVQQENSSGAVRDMGEGPQLDDAWIRRQELMSDVISVPWNPNAPLDNPLAGAVPGPEAFTERVTALDKGYTVVIDPLPLRTYTNHFGQTTVLGREPGEVSIYQSGVQAYKHRDLGTAYFWLRQEERDKVKRDLQKADQEEKAAERRAEAAQQAREAEALANAGKLTERVAELEAIIKRLTTNADDA